MTGMRFTGRKGTVAIYFLDYTADDSGTYGFYHVANSHGGLAYSGLQQRCGLSIEDTTSETGITGIPYQSARIFDGATSEADILTANSAATPTGDPYVLDVAYPSIEAWIKPSSFTGSVQTIAGYYPSSSVGGYKLYIDASGNLTFALRDGGGTEYINAYSMADQTAGQWYYVAATFDGVNVRLYVNGLLKSTGGNSATISYGSQTVSDLGMIGYDINGGSFTNYFTGSIAAVRFSNHPVPPWEIYRIYNADSDPTLALDSTDAYHTYNFNDDTDPNNTDTITDDNGNADAVCDGDKNAGSISLPGPMGGFTEFERLGLRMNATYGYAHIPDASLSGSPLDDREQDMTVEMWLSIDEDAPASQDAYLIAKRRYGIAFTTPLELRVDYSSGGYILCRFADDYATNSLISTSSTGRKLIETRLCYLVMTWNASTGDYKVYINGIWSGAGNAIDDGVDISACANNEPCWIGAVYDHGLGTPTYCANAQIHALRISASVLSPEQICKNFSGFTPTEDNS